jgi:NAD(P) transhydrogenase subunit alpha
MSFVDNLTLFVLAAFVGYAIISRIPNKLHTPLLSGSNAISGITLVGSVVVAGAGESTLATALGFLAVVMATVNVVGGYLVSHLMLQDFHEGGAGP